MPTYEYECQSLACKHAWEEEQSIHDPPLQFCAECGEPTAKRLISRTGFVLAGDGWASSGYSKGSDPSTS
jgi:putative FmdB family regulatory protein